MSISFVDETRKHVEKFLQTAVIIDDRTHLSKERKPPKPGLAIPHRGAKRKLSPEKLPLETSPEEERGIDVEELINGFAAHGIVCGVMRYQEDDKSSENFINTAQNADISIVDWQLESSKTGEAALELISRLVSDDIEYPLRFRLICIYTGSNDLSEISEKIKSFFKEKFEIKLESNEKGLRLSYKSLIISIYAKNEEGLPHQYKSVVVSEVNLSDVLISEFVSSIAGILSNGALSCISSIRNNAHRLLAKFHPGLDAAYLSHRVLLDPPDEAQEHLIPLVISEIENILEDNNVSECISMDVIDSWLECKIKSGHSFRKKMRVRQSEAEAQKDIFRLLKKGIAKERSNNKKKLFGKLMSEILHEKTKHAISKLTGVFCDDTIKPERIDREFASLMSIKSIYTSRPPKMETGAIISLNDGNTEHFWICIQPVCDCVRLPARGRNFLFLPLEEDDQQFNLSLLLKDHYKDLKISNQSYSVKNIFFIPPKRGLPVVAQKEGRNWFFSSGDLKYKWIGTLKRIHAQRLVHDYSKSISRVGLTESEWQRRWAK